MEMQRYISAEAYEEMMAQPEYTGRHIDLVEGELLEMPKPTLGHGQIEMRLAMLIGNFVSARDLGSVTGGDAGFVLERRPDGKDTVRGLDLAFISRQRSLPFAHGLVAPDLAVEIVSPSNTAADIHLKVRQLLRAGTALVWVVYPETRSVEAHTDDGAMTYAEDDTLDGGDVLPGFTVRVGDIFPA